MVNSHRLLVRGERVDNVPAVQEQELQVNRQLEFYKRLFFASLIALLLLMAYIIRREIKKRKKKS